MSSFEPFESKDVPPRIIPPGDDPAIREANGKKLAAGILAILLGWLGVHKFVLGYSTEGTIMLLISVLSCFTLSWVPGVIGIAEGVIYLTKSDDDFYSTYIANQRGWF